MIFLLVRAIVDGCAGAEGVMAPFVLIDGYKLSRDSDEIKFE